MRVLNAEIVRLDVDGQRDVIAATIDIGGPVVRVAEFFDGSGVYRGPDNNADGWREFEKALPLLPEYRGCEFFDYSAKFSAVLDLLDAELTRLLP